MKKISVLVIDNRRLVREALTDLIQNNDTFKATATSANYGQALLTAESESPDVILLSITDSLEMISALSQASPESKIIVLSAASNPPFVNKILKLGASGYITTNTSILEILPAIMPVVNGEVYICKDIHLTKEQIKGNWDEQGFQILGAREFQVMKMLRMGLTAKQIGDALNISSRTVNTHRTNIFKKLKINNIQSLVTLAYNSGL